MIKMHDSQSDKSIRHKLASSNVQSGLFIGLLLVTPQIDRWREVCSKQVATQSEWVTQVTTELDRLQSLLYFLPTDLGRCNWLWGIRSRQSCFYCRDSLATGLHGRLCSLLALTSCFMLWMLLSYFWCGMQHVHCPKKKQCLSAKADPFPQLALFIQFWDLFNTVLRLANPWVWQYQFSVARVAGPQKKQILVLTQCVQVSVSNIP